jgi:hypothetical protein
VISCALGGVYGRFGLFNRLDRYHGTIICLLELERVSTSAWSTTDMFESSKPRSAGSNC